MDVEVAKTRVALTHLLAATIKLAKSVSTLSSALEKQEDRDKFRESLEAFLVEIDKTLEALGAEKSE